MRSRLGQARGLGSAKSGFHHWWAQKVTSFALVPLTVWFVWSVVHLIGHSRAEVAQYIANPLVAALLMVTVATTFYHLEIGLESVVLDYVRDEKRKIATLMVIKGVSLVLVLTTVVAILKLAITG
jgi:succinate dehydrogenase / fumarate reductase membrane anchor subunit